MNDEPATRRTIIGAFPSGMDVHAFQDIAGPLIADAQARLDAEKAAAEALARSRVTVDRAWLLEVLRDLICSMESHRKLADRRGDHARGRALWRKAWERRDAYDALAKDDLP